MSSRRGIVATLSLVLGAAALVSAPVAVSSGNDSAREDCARSSEHRLRVVVNDENSSRLTVIGVVFSNDEDVWEWRMKHNGDISADGKVQAKDRERSFRIQRTMIDLTGPDTIQFAARNTVTGELCIQERDF
ncbi:MAG: hypothetical protein WB767_11965 [Nocardioides sp.]